MEQSLSDELARESIELELFIQAMHRRYGYDFSQYAPASLRRRVRQLAERIGCDSISVLTGRALHEPKLLPQLLEGLSVPVSDMFRDPAVFRALREQVDWPALRAVVAHSPFARSFLALCDELGITAGS